MRFSNILVPTDFSPLSDHAALSAATLARSVGGRVTLFHVYNPPVVMLPDGSTFAATPAELVAITSRVDDELREAKRSLQARVAGVDIETVAVIGDAVGEILGAAAGGTYDVIVMATHGRGVLGRMLLGSVTERVLRRAAIPVMAVHARDDVALEAAATRGT